MSESLRKEPGEGRQIEKEKKVSQNGKKKKRKN